ncbi:T9SS type A sorting domain-containing protein [Flavicella sp.]|uniref:T9SS type A sorting domain-containing protein n=1 Tax=Flavicella sp. TaxID=2957742 RepID=UPI00263406D4|nr:T9SS type A sorting domain-containing protein [Flavicella sp.]MDG1805496.1 right-handed parallel beta-helix repeat-containing protein [Flavicella sp.]
MISFKKLFLIPVILMQFQISARDIYVSKSGNDTNSGTETSPYLSITKAANVAVAGDVVFIKEGTYEETLAPANSGSSGNPIIFQSYPGDRVIISAMQALEGWTQDSGSIYKTTIPFNSLGQENFVMHNETALDLARWPNKVQPGAFSLNSLRNTGGSNSNVINNAYLEENTIPNIDWTDGAVWFYGDKPGSGWIAWKSIITSSSSGRVNFNLDKDPDWIRTFHAPADLGDFYLEGVKAALDYQNEWYFNPSTMELFIQLPGGSAPEDGNVKMRRRKETINLKDRKHIEIRNLAVFGGGINMEDSTTWQTNSKTTNNVLYGISSFYGAYTQGVVTSFNSGVAALKLQGSYNTIEKCEIAFGAGTGINARGENNTIKDNYIHDFNTLGSYDAPAVLRGMKNSKFINNTVSNGGRDAVNYSGENNEIAYNDISKSNLIADDCGLFYTVGRQNNTVIHHNWFHDALSRDGLKKAAGIYLDNNAAGFSVHHNVIWNTKWTGIQINWNGTDIDIFNNTLWNNEGGTMGAWHKEGTAFSNVNVWNNLGGDDEWEPQSDKQNNLTTTADSFQNISTGNFNLTATSEAIDSGKLIPGITDGYIGNSPDIGANEYGGTKWVAGVTWNYKLSPNGLGCYGLPGEDCLTFPKDDQDKDGVGDADDICPDTPFGTPVNTQGCPVFTLETDNFKILSTGETCSGAADGTISIIANENLEYIATLENSSIANEFNNATSFSGLAAGNYVIKISIKDNDSFLQSFNLNITQPSNLFVKSNISKNKKTVNLELSGAEFYRIRVNETTYMTDQNEFEIELTAPSNKILVSTNKDCQGTHEESISISNTQLFASNPVGETLLISTINFLDYNLNYQIYSTTGQIIKSGQTQLLDNSIIIDFSDIPSGMYLINIISKNHKIQSKIIKK